MEDAIAWNELHHRTPYNNTWDYPQQPNCPITVIELLDLACLEMALDLG